MVATLLIETSLALYTVWRYKMTSISRLIVAALIGLATFQLAEYFVCTGYGLHAEQWSRVGFVAITTLPPLGLHILHVISNKPSRKLVNIAYASMVGFMVFFLTYPTSFIGHQCTGNYVIFQIGYRMGGFYAVYYYGWLLIAIGLGIRWANQLRNKEKTSSRRLESIRALIIGYLVFLLPTGIANTVKPATRQGIPSIMCGFAIIFALIIALYILPRMGTSRAKAAKQG